VYSYQTPQQGIAATIQTLKGPIGNYGPILAALRAGTNPMAVAQAIAGSQWGTGSGVIRQLGGQAPISPNASVPASMPPGQPAVPGAGPKPPQFNMPPAPSVPSSGGFPSLGSMGGTPDLSATVLNNIISGGNMNDLTNSIIGAKITPSNKHP